MVKVDNDQAAYLTLACVLFMALTVLSISLRGVSRWPWKEQYGRDDTIAIGAVILCLAQGTTVLYKMGDRPGQLPPDVHKRAVEHYEMLLYASDLIFILAVYASKVSSTVSLFRIANRAHRRQRLYIDIILQASGVFLLASFIAVAAQPAAYKAVKDTIGTWIAYAVMSSIIDVTIAIYPVYLVFGLQMSSKDKWKVGISYGLRILLIPIAALRIYFLSQARDDYFPYRYGILTQAEMSVAMMATTLPCVRPFLVRAQTGLFDLEKVVSHTDRSSVFTAPKPKPKMRPRSERPINSESRTISAITAARNIDELMAIDVEPRAIDVRKDVDVEKV